jgi:hypothetical protein
VDITIKAYGNPYFLPSLAHLWSHQIGYRIHGITRERIMDWDDDWLVIADEGGDPFIFSRANGTVLHAFHGEGVWDPKPIFENLPEMAITLAIIGDVVASAGKFLTDDASMIMEKYWTEAKSRIAHVTGSNDRADDIVSTLGWG